MLALPAEPAYLHSGLVPVSFQDESTHNRTCDTQIGLALLLGILLDVMAVDRFNVAVSQQADGDSIANDLFL